MSVVFTPQRMRISADRYEKMVETGVLTSFARADIVSPRAVPAVQIQVGTLFPGGH
jgi:hypothetical protein